MKIYSNAKFLRKTPFIAEKTSTAEASELSLLLAQSQSSKKTEIYASQRVASGVVKRPLEAGKGQSRP